MMFLPYYIILIVIDLFISLITEVYAYLSIKCPSGFLQTEVIVQFLIREVPALERQVVASAVETVRKAQVV